MDFYKIITERTDRKGYTISADYKVGRTKDLMVRGGKFYAIWDEAKGLWSTDMFDVQRLIDEDLERYFEEHMASFGTDKVTVSYLRSSKTRAWRSFLEYVKDLPDNYHQLDTKVTFADTEVTKKDYVSKRLPYSLKSGKMECYEELINTLYSPEEKEKIEWAIGSIIAGDSKTIQKFFVFYGGPGTGKSTVLEIIQKIFEGYWSVFDAKALASTSNLFATELIKSNPLVAIQHDGDLSRIEDNTLLNSIASHETISINEKFKAQYEMKPNCLMFMGTNTPVKITDDKSGIKRRLIDIHPTGLKIPPDRFFYLKDQIEQFEIGAIAKHCLDVYLKAGKDYYKDYVPIDMMYKTDLFFNFIEENYILFKEQNFTTLAQAYGLYKEYFNDSGLSYKLTKPQIREKLEDYFESRKDEGRLPDGSHVRHYYEGFMAWKFDRVESVETTEQHNGWIEFKEGIESKLDILAKDMPAQTCNDRGTPITVWADNSVTLKDIDTHELHFLQLPKEHIVIDLDIPDENGNKCLEKNLAAANKFPKTYAELSKSGSGIHLHYIYTGDTKELKSIYGEHIEIKTFAGNSAIRRKLTKCNDLDISEISSGLPLKEKKSKMIDDKIIKNEKQLRSLIKRNLKKEIHPATKPSVDFINKLLDDAYESGMSYDVTDMRPAVLSFGLSSTHNSSYCLQIINNMKWHSDNASDFKEADMKDIVFYDIEVFPNLFLINWKKLGIENKIVRMANPKPYEVEQLLQYNLVGFNNRRYDNHIIYARILGYTNEELYRLSQRIISTEKEQNANCFFGEAYNISYTDIYEYSSKKQSLKKWEIELGLKHHELGLDWNKPVPEELWDTVAEYCDDDVYATEAVWHATQQDFKARQILSEISGLSVNDTTRMHATKIIFENNKNPQLVYTDLSKEFPGYKFDNGTSTYRGEVTGEGGYVFAVPGMYSNVALLDIASMHPTTIDVLNLFGEYTDNFRNIKSARLYIKHRELDKLKGLFSGKLMKYLGTDEEMDSLAYALKLVINSVYGYTTAKFPNVFKDVRNKDNIVAKRGALFMINLKHEVLKRGFKVAHIKTDSIKIPDATPEIIQFVMDYGKKYGYNFEHEATYEKMCLVNDAVYIAKYDNNVIINGKHAGQWTATGTEFAVPFIFKTLFSHENLEFEDYCETKTVSSGTMYLDLNEGYDDVSYYENIRKLRDTDKESITKKGLKLIEETSDISDEELNAEIAKGHKYQFVGKAGQFTPVKSGYGGGKLYRFADNKYYAVTGTKDYLWLESDVAKSLPKEAIDISYYTNLADKAIEDISVYGDFETFKD